MTFVGGQRGALVGPAPLRDRGEAGPQLGHLRPRGVGSGPDLAERVHLAGRDLEDRRQRPPPVSRRLAIGHPDRHDQVRVGQPTECEVLGLEAGGGQVVTAPPVEHALGTPGVEDAEATGGGERMESRHRPRSDDARSGEDDRRPRAAERVDRFGVGLDPPVHHLRRRHEDVGVDGRREVEIELHDDGHPGGLRMRQCRGQGTDGARRVHPHRRGCGLNGLPILMVMRTSFKGRSLPSVLIEAMESITLSPSYTSP